MKHSLDSPDNCQRATQYGLLTIEQCALGLYWAWVWLFYECDNLLEPLADSSMTLTMFRFASLISMAAVLFIGALLSRWLDSNRGIVLLSVISIFAGPLGLMLTHFPLLPIVPLLGAILIGASEGALSFLWAIYIMKHDGSRSYQAYCVAVSVVIGSIVFLALTLLNTNFLPAVAACLPVAAGVIYLSSEIFTQDAYDDENVGFLACLRAGSGSLFGASGLHFFYSDKDTSKDLSEYNHVLRDIFIALFIYGVVYGCLRYFAARYTSPQPFLTIGCFLFAGTAFAIYVRRTKTRSLTLIWRLILPVTLVGLAMVPLYRMSWGLIAAPIAQTGYMLFESIIWIVLFDAIFRLDLNKLAVFGVGRGISVLGMAIGAVLPLLAGKVPILGTLSDDLILIAIITGILLIIVNKFLLNEQEVATAGLLEIDESAQEQMRKAPRNAPLSIQEACSVIGESKQLTTREIEILSLLAEGKSGPQISDELFLSKATVKTHTYNIYRKLEVHTRADLLATVQRVQQRRRYT